MLNSKPILISFILLPFLLIGQFKKKDSLSIQNQNKKVDFVVIPTFTYNNSFGGVFGAMGSAFFKFDQNDQTSPLSSSMLVANYSTNNTWYFILPNSFYFKEDKFRARAAVGLGSIEFQTYFDWGDLIGNLPPHIFPPPGIDGIFIDFNNKFQFAYASFLVRTFGKVYLGGNILAAHSKTTFDVVTKPEDEQTMFGFGFNIELDTRDNQFEPRKGNNGKLITNHFFESLGSSSNYSNISFQYNKYFQLQERNTIMGRLYAQVALGDVPFSAKNVVGRDDLRGYSNGKYRANQVYDAQTEYRHWFNLRWGLVAFGGIATAIDEFEDLAFDNLLPAVGAGIRFLAIPKARINVGIDAAIGKDDWGLYFRIGEAFSR